MSCSYISLYATCSATSDKITAIPLEKHALMTHPHYHLICRSTILRQFEPAEVSTWVVHLTAAIGMELAISPIIYHSTEPDNCGTTCVAIITTSHIAVHTWNLEEGSLWQLDVYSCRHFSTDAVLGCLQSIGAVDVEYLILDRASGLREIEHG